MTPYPGVPAFAQPTFEPQDVLRLTHAEKYGVLLGRSGAREAALERAWSRTVAQVTRRAGRAVAIPDRRWFTLVPGRRQ